MSKYPQAVVHVDVDLSDEEFARLVDRWQSWKTGSARPITIIHECPAPDLYEALKAVEFSGTLTDGHGQEYAAEVCPKCHHEYGGHTDTCIVGNAIKKVENV